MAETWVIKDNAPVDEASYVLNRTNVLFTSGGKEFIAVEILDDGAVVLGLTYYGSDDKVVQPAFLRYGDGETQFYWNAPAYKTLEFDTAPTGEFLAWLTKNADKQSDTEYLTRKSELTLVANAIRTKTGSAAQISFPDGYVTEISTLTNTSADTVTADKLLEGTTAHDKSGKQITGTMGELHGLAYTGGAITTPGSGGSYSIPASYIPEDTRYVKGNDETVVNVTIPKTKFGDATAADVAKGKTFTSAAGLKVTGTAEGSSPRPVDVALKNTDFTEVWVGYVPFRGNMTQNTIAQGETRWYSVEEGSEIVVANTAFDGGQIDLSPSGGFIIQQVDTSNITAFIVDYSLNSKIVELLLK